MPKNLLSPEAARDFLVRRFNNQHQTWLAGGGVWPLQVSLGVPTEKETTEDPVAVRAWVVSWSAWTGAGEVIWEDRKWARLGAQSLPVCMSVTTADAAAALVGQTSRWNRACVRYARMLSRWEQLEGNGALTSRFNVLADYSEIDFGRLFSLLEWLDTHPASNVYLRQLPVEGLDTKWIEQRTGVVAGLLKAIRRAQGEDDFYGLCGLRKPAHRIRIHILCPNLRRAIGGLRDIEAPANEIAALQITPASALIVENLDSGRALPDIPGTVCVMKLGNAVSVLEAIPWLRGVNAVYWGDIDTHGFAILERARRAMPGLRSVLMDEATLLAYKPLWGQEPVQCPNLELAQLHAHERGVYASLRANVWAQKVRLEQERLPWELAIAALTAALIVT